MYRVLLLLAVISNKDLLCSGQRRPPVRSDVSIVRGNPNDPDSLGPGKRNLPLGLAIFQQFVAQYARLNLYQPNDPFVPVYYVEGFDKVPLRWNKRIKVMQLAPNIYPADTLAEQLYAANYIDGNVPETGYPNPYDPRRYDPFSTKPGFRNVPGFGPSRLTKRRRKRSLRQRRQAQPVRDPNSSQPSQPKSNEPTDLAAAAAKAGLSSDRFNPEDFRRIAEEQERERQRKAAEARKRQEEEERQRIQNYIDSLGLDRISGPVQEEDLQYNRNCLRHFRGPFPHPSYLNGVLVDACNQPIPSEYILGARPGSKKGRIIKEGDYQERHAGYDFLGRPIPQPDAAEPLWEGCKWDDDDSKEGKHARSKTDGTTNTRRRRICKNEPPLLDPKTDPFQDIPTVRPVYPIDPLTGRFRNPGVNAQTWSRFLSGFVPRGQNPLPQLRNIYENAEGKTFYGNPGK